MRVTIPKYQGFGKLSPADRRWFVHRLTAAGYDPAKAAEVIEFESARTWSPSVAYDFTRNTSQPRTGLIQFTRDGGAKLVGKSVAELAAMTFREQLEYCLKYWDAWGPERLNYDGNGLNNYHLAGWGDGVGAPSTYVLAHEGSSKYKANSGLDEYPVKGEITAGELDKVTRSRVLRGVVGEWVFDPRAPLTIEEAQGDIAANISGWLSTVVGLQYWQAVTKAVGK